MAVVGRRIDRQTVMAALVDEVRGERPDRIGTEPASLRLGAQEEVDPRAPEVGLGLLDGLNVADDVVVCLDDEGQLVRVAAGQVRADAVKIECAPPARDLRLGKDRRERGASSRVTVRRLTIRPRISTRPSLSD